MWEDQWLRCAKHLDQWEVLSGFSKSVENPELHMEAAWHIGAWKIVKNMVDRYQLLESPYRKKFHLQQIYLAIHENKDHGKGGDRERRMQDREIEKLCETSMQFALREWRTLPAFVSNSHCYLFQRFQRIVELQESGQMLLEM